MNFIQPTWEFLVYLFSAIVIGGGMVAIAVWFCDWIVDIVNLGRE